MAVIEVKTGMILMWSGSIVDIPAGFVLCNGSNGTPDLRGRFVVGAGDAYDVNDTGGSVTHDHTASGVIEEPYLADGPYVSAGATYSKFLDGDTVDVTIDSANGLPPYYSLAFIMKT